MRNLKDGIKISPGACPERTDRFLATLEMTSSEGVEMTNRVLFVTVHSIVYPKTG